MDFLKQLARTRIVRRVKAGASRLALWALRTFRPVCRIGDKVLVTRHADVRQVLSLSAAYSVRRYGSRMRETGPDFFLGHDAGRQRQDERDAALGAIQSLGTLRPRDIAAHETQAVIQQRAKGVGSPRPPGRQPCYLDVVEDLADRVPVRIAEDYFGLRNPSGRTLLEWIQLTSWYIFNPFASGEDRERAIRAGEQMKEHVRRLVQSGRAHPPRGTVLAELLATPLSDEAVARTLTGMVAGSLGPPPRFFAKAVNRLLGLRGRTRRRLAEAARDRDFAGVETYLLEAARFDPDPSLLYRACERVGTTLAGHPIATGDTVVCFVQSALRDGRSIAAPWRFRLGRPAAELMLFGHGLHECIGRGVGMATLTGMAQPLFALPGLRRAPGRAGSLRDGPLGEFPAQNYPQHLGVLFARPA